MGIGFLGQQFSTMYCLQVISVFLLIIASRAIHPDFGLTPIELIEKHGYPAETHEVETQDGYLLTMHRIPSSSNGPPAFLMHGILSNSADFVNMGPGKALAFLLAEQGFDVWLGNQRGNTWSRKHISVDPDSNPEQFFDFSFHEIGMHDLPAMIDYILNTTNQKQLTYVGHSQGTTAFFAMASEKPEYNEKIRLMYALAPVAYMEHVPSPLLKLFVKHHSALQKLVTYFKMYEFLPHSDAFIAAGRKFCCKESKFKEICAAILFAFGGFDSDQLDRDFIPVIATNTPAGAAMKQISHYLQEINSTHFCQFDYGQDNMKRYGQKSPPDYDISKITTPIILHYAKNDYMASTIDVEKLARQLPNLHSSKLIPLPKFAHLDFLWATDIVDLLNKHVVDAIVSFK